jgi:hypothetical protein
MLTYFIDINSVESQGTIPLKGCVIDVPNDGRKSFSLRGRIGFSGYEIRISHNVRRPFVLALSTSAERDEWRKYLTQYIATVFISEEYRLAEVVETVCTGFYAVQRKGTLGVRENCDRLQLRGVRRHVYIDWLSPDPSLWGLRSDPHPLLAPPHNTTDDLLYTRSSSTKLIPLRLISQVSLDPPAPSSHTHNLARSIRITFYNSSEAHADGIGALLTLTPIIASSAGLWHQALLAALQLQDMAYPAGGTHRRTKAGMRSLRAQLSSASEPRQYTRDTFLKEREEARKANAVLAFDSSSGMGLDTLEEGDLWDSDAEEQEDHYHAPPSAGLLPLVPVTPVTNSLPMESAERGDGEESRVESEGTVPHASIAQSGYVSGSVFRGDDTL